ncbi:MAG TPA: sigma-70 family RNA polymerase sigma factor [bacterium]|nr:sigma-70 family RNA polymerase sigma factor [bacterium]
MDAEGLTARFEANRSRLRSVAYRMLGSLSEADDAVQETWLRLSRSENGAIRDLDRWLTTVAARVCLDMLRARKSRREEPFEEHLPDPIVTRDDGGNPEQATLLADSVGLALLVVLETLPPPERLAFVLHDVFAMPFEEIAPIVERSPAAARQLASRARRRVKGAAVPDADLASQRKLVDAFLAAAQGGNFDALVAVLDPDVALRGDRGAAAPILLRGAQTVARSAVAFSAHAGLDLVIRPALVNGVAGIVSWLSDGRAYSVMAFTVARGKIVEIDVLTDPERLARLDLSSLRP